MALIILLILSEDDIFNKTIHSIVILYIWDKIDLKGWKDYILIYIDKIHIIVSSLFES